MKNYKLVCGDLTILVSPYESDSVTFSEIRNNVNIGFNWNIPVLDFIDSRMRGITFDFVGKFNGINYDRIDEFTMISELTNVKVIPKVKTLTCECGAAKLGIKDYMVGHSLWCNVSHK